MSDEASEVRNHIGLSIPEISGDEWKYVKECLDTGWVSSVGSFVDRFENSVASFVGSRFAVAVVNGTSAIHLSLIVSEVCAGDAVIVPALTFIAPVNALRYCGAEPLFMDCVTDTLTLDVDKFREYMEQKTVSGADGYRYSKKSGRRIKAIIPVHVFGHPVDMEPLLEVANGFKVTVIEDAAESLGSKYKGAYTGTFGLMGCFSFNGNKIITTGGGGMVVTNDPDVECRLRHLSTQAKKDPFEYDHDMVGYNYRLTNVLAAIGCAQMERLDEFVAIKRKNLSLYEELLAGVSSVRLLPEKNWALSNNWFYTLKVAHTDRVSLMDSLLSNGIQVRPVWKLMTELAMFAGFESYRIENAKASYSTCINIPCSVNLKQEEISFVCESIKAFFA